MAVNNTGSSGLEGVRGRAATPEEVAQRDGYVQGRNDEYATQSQMRAQEQLAAQRRADDSAASGLLTGLLLALLAAGVGALAYFLLTPRTDVTPATAPQIERETIRERETTIIEREAPTPDVSLPDVQIDVPDVSLPDVNITNEAPAEAEPTEAPAAEAEAPADVEGSEAP